jgi:hypothetical protein
MHEIAFDNQEVGETKAITIWWVCRSVICFTPAQARPTQLGQSALRLVNIIDTPGWPTSNFILSLNN